MSGIILYTSNHLETLAVELAAQIRDAGDPLRPEVIVVQSRGMERWLSLAIARHNGITANCQFPFPKAFVEDIFARRFDFDAAANPFQRDTLTFRILRTLPHLVKGAAAFQDLRTYLTNDRRGCKGFALAAEIADLLDQYMVFRPGMLLDWEKNDRAGRNLPFPWQAALWRRLTREIEGPHPAALWQALTRRASGVAESAVALPARVAFFGISYLPPYYLEILQSLAPNMDIAIYQLSPCQEYWADIASEREMENIRRRSSATDQTFGPQELHLETGNRLLASLGGHGREFHGLIAEFEGPVEERFEDVAPDSLLGRLQHDLLHLIDRGAASPEEGREAPPNSEDRSIQVHACHGPMREIEVLQDQILDLLATHPDLEPRHILVMTPDIETYAPFIQAVFGAPSDDRHDLPFSIADRCLETASPLVEHFDLLLDLRGARFTVSEILTLLEFAPLRAAFGLDESDVALATDLIDRVHIRWGLDGGSKTEWQLPAVDANTWQQGLDRLILGHVLHPEPDRFFQHLMPADSLQGGEARIIGCLHTLLEALGELGRALDRPRTIERWHRRLTGVLAKFFRRDERWEYDFQVIERLLGTMRQVSQQAAFDAPVDLDVVRACYKRQLSRETYRGGFIAGGITFGALLPMRSIPAAVIALVGMNHDLFPRLDRPRSFDLMARDPRRGDRSRRSDDRYLFLESLISARRCLYISYTGFDPHDNAVQPPSVLVSELMDYLQDNYGRRTEDLLTTHRLQPFAPAYFQEDARLFSYNRDQARAARRLNDADKTRPHAGWFLSSALSRCSPAFWDLTAEDLRDALHHPCRFLLERRMDLRLRQDEPLDRDREAFALDPLTRFQTGQWLAGRMLAGMTRREGLSLLEARGVLPHGETGASAARRLLDDIAVFTDRIRPHVDVSPRPARSYRIARDGYLLSGRIANLYPDGPVFFRYSRAGGRALLDAWIQHLIYCQLASEEGRRGTTILICRDEMRRFEFADDHRALIGDLCDLYFEALHSPLAIFPQSTTAFGRQCYAQGKSVPQALAAARRVWEGSFTLPGDKDDPYIRLGFRGRDPWTQGFGELAERLFAPLFAHSETFI